MIYTWTGGKVTAIKKYNTTDENIKEFVDGIIAEIDVEWDDGNKDHKLVNIYNLKADGGIHEITAALNH